MYTGEDHKIPVPVEPTACKEKLLTRFCYLLVIAGALTILLSYIFRVTEIAGAGPWTWYASGAGVGIFVLGQAGVMFSRKLFG